MLNSTKSLPADDCKAADLPLPAALNDLYAVLHEIEGNQTVLEGRLYTVLEPVDCGQDKSDSGRAPDSRVVDALRSIEYRLQCVRRHQIDLLHRLHV